MPPNPPPPGLLLPLLSSSAYPFSLGISEFALKEQQAVRVDQYINRFDCTNTGSCGGGKTGGRIGGGTTGGVSGGGRKEEDDDTQHTQHSHAPAVTPEPPVTASAGASAADSSVPRFPWVLVLRPVAPVPGKRVTGGEGGKEGKGGSEGSGDSEGGGKSKSRVDESAGAEGFEGYLDQLLAIPANTALYDIFACPTPAAAAAPAGLLRIGRIRTTSAMAYGFPSVFVLVLNIHISVVFQVCTRELLKQV